MKKILSITLALLLMSYTQVQAVTLDDVMSQINSLKAEVAQLKNSMNGKVLGATATAISRTLAPGLKKDPEVMKLQAFLKKESLFMVNPDGNYGPLTTQAVKNFQAKSNLAVTGVVDLKTLSLINELSVSTRIDKALDLDADAFIENLKKQTDQLQEILKNPKPLILELENSWPPALEDVSGSRVIFYNIPINGTNSCLRFMYMPNSRSATPEGYVYIGVGLCGNEPIRAAFSFTAEGYDVITIQ